MPGSFRRADPGQSGRSGAWTLDDQPGLIQHSISASSRDCPPAATTDLMSGATALGGMFTPGRSPSACARRPAAHEHGQATAALGIGNMVPWNRPRALAGVPGFCALARGEEPSLRMSAVLSLGSLAD
jgi:hypothetical protein